MQTETSQRWSFHHHATLCIAAYGFLIAEAGDDSPQQTVPFSTTASANGDNAEPWSGKGSIDCRHNEGQRVIVTPLRSDHFSIRDDGTFDAGKHRKNSLAAWLPDLFGRVARSKSRSRTAARQRRWT